MTYKRIFLVLPLLSLLSVGCAMDSRQQDEIAAADETTSSEVIQETTPDATLSDVTTETADTETVDTGAVDEVAEPVVTQEENRESVEISTDVTRLETIAVTDRIELFIINPERFGDRDNPIVIDLSSYADYRVLIRNEGELTMQILPLQQAFSLRNMRRVGQHDIRFDSDADRDESVVDYGAVGAVDQIQIDEAGSLRMETTYEVEPLFQRVISQFPSYEVSRVNERWQVHFQEESLTLLKQLRPERHAGERKEIEAREQINFDSMAVDLFSTLLSMEPIQEGLAAQGITGLQAKDIWAIRQFIEIVAEGTE